MLQLSLLGPIRLRFQADSSGSSRVYLLSGHQGALLAYLGLREHIGFQAARGRLAGALWPDVNEERARQLLSNTLYRLQKTYPDLAPYLRLTAETAALQDVQLDLVQFQKLSASSDLSDWQNAIDLVQGELLEELDVEWAQSERALFRESYLALLTRACHQLAQSSDLADVHQAVLLGRRWVHEDAYDEQAHLFLMQLYTRLGRHGAARKQYAVLEGLLDDDLGMIPSEGISAFARSLNTAVVDSDHFVFVGREKERAILQDRLHQLQKNGRGGVVLIEGEPGIGKTTLLRELERSAGWQQIKVAWGGCDTSSPEQATFAPLSQAMQSLQKNAYLKSIIKELPPLVYDLLQPLFEPSTKGNSQITPLPTSRFLADMPQTAALRYLGQRILAEAPLVMLLDDLQWAGAQFWPMLESLLSLTANQPLLLVGTYRGWELRQNESVWTKIQAALVHANSDQLLLTGFSNAEVDQFVSNTGVQQKGEQTADSAQLYKLSAGNPLLLQELLGQGKPHKGELTPLLTDRLTRLSSADRQSLLAASVIGHEIDYDLWCVLTEKAINGAVLARLIDSRFILETADGYIFQHDLVRLHLYQKIDPQQRLIWHRSAAQWLQKVGGSPSSVAWHYAQGEAYSEAVHYYVRAADLAFALRAHESAKQYGGLAFKLAQQAELTPLETLHLRWLRLQLLHQERPSSENMPLVDALIADAQEAMAEDLLLRVTLIKFDLLSGQGDVTNRQLVQDEIENLIEEVGNPPLEIEALQQLALKSSFTVGDSAKGLVYARWGEEIAGTVPKRPELLAEAKLILIACLLSGRFVDEALQSLNEVKEILSKHPQLYQIESDWLYMWAVAAQFTGDWELSHRLHEQTLEKQREIGNFYALTSALYNTANSASAQGRHESAILWATEMVELADEQLANDDYVKKLQYRTLLANCYALAELYESVFEALDPVYDWLDTQGDGVTAVRAWSVIGRAYIGLNRLEEGYTAHRRGIDLSQNLGSVSGSHYLALAEACFLTGRLVEGGEVMTEAEKRIDFTGASINTHTYFFYLRYQYDGELEDLRRAYDALQTQVARFSDATVQQNYVDRILLHRQVMAAWRDQQPELLTVRLVKDDVPLGRPLQDGDFIVIQWTVDDGIGDAAVLQTTGKAGLRRHRLKRLMDEAKRQHATPSFADLAQALSVSSRTIERDIKLLAQQGVELHTRRHRVH